MVRLLDKSPFKLGEFRERGLKVVDKGYQFSVLYVLEEGSDLYLLFRGKFRNGTFSKCVVIEGFESYYFCDLMRDCGEDLGYRLVNDGLIGIYRRIGRLGYIR